MEYRAVQPAQKALSLFQIYYMSACRFTIPVSGSTTDALNKARSAVQSQGGTFSGNEQSGHFDVTVFGNTIKGSYTAAAQNIEIVIDSKPFLLPCSTIEGFLKNQLGP